MSDDVVSRCTNVSIVEGIVYHIPPAPEQWREWNFDRKVQWLQSHASPRMPYQHAVKELSHRAALAREARSRRPRRWAMTSYTTTDSTTRT